MQTKRKLSQNRKWNGKFLYCSKRNELLYDSSFFFIEFLARWLTINHKNRAYHFFRLQNYDVKSEHEQFKIMSHLISMIVLKLHRNASTDNKTRKLIYCKRKLWGIYIVAIYLESNIGALEMMVILTGNVKNNDCHRQSIKTRIIAWKLRKCTET